MLRRLILVVGIFAVAGLTLFLAIFTRETIFTCKVCLKERPKDCARGEDHGSETDGEGFARFAARDNLCRSIEHSNTSDEPFDKRLEKCLTRSDSDFQATCTSRTVWATPFDNYLGPR